MAKIDSLDNLIAEFEQAAGAISQLKLLVSNAETLKSKLEAMLGNLQNEVNVLHSIVDTYHNGISDTDGLKTGLKQQIGEAQTFVSNSSKTLVVLKNEVNAALEEVAAKTTHVERTADYLTTEFAILQKGVVSKTDVAISEFESNNKQLRQDLSSFVNQAIASLPDEFAKYKQELGSNSSRTLVGLKNEVNAVLEEVAAKTTHVEKTADYLTTEFAILQKGVVSKTNEAISEFESNNNRLRQDLSSFVNQAIASLPDEFAKYKQELEKKVQAALSGALHEFMGRQATLVSNLNQRNDALQSLVDTQRSAMSGQLDAALLRIEKLEGVIAKRTGIFGLFKQA